jgi:hypothetical protein
MAQSRTTVFSDTTEIAATTARAYLKGVFASINPSATLADVFVQLWDVANPTPGSTAPDIALYIPQGALSGGKYTFRWEFPRTYCVNGITYFAATAAGGGTASTIIDAVEVYYELA